MDNVQMDSIPRQVKIWVAGETERFCDYKKLLLEGGRMEEGIYNNQETVETGGAGGDIISVEH